MPNDSPTANLSAVRESQIKRLLDLLMAAFALICSAPFWATIGLAIVLEDGWPILYAQPRVGKGGRVFRFLKFRSMVKDAERFSGAVLAEKDDPRITCVGRILRKAALDEIPQLLSIFRGDMSWVGPRPERPEFVREFSRTIPGYADRHAVRPGLTGLAQVYGRYHTDPADKLRYDLHYIAHRSLLLDFRLFVKSWLITAKGRWDATTEAR
jgi:lipopolysaccharide/colanic/teichoic acid biosynthesis glycosyltransferase